MSKKLNHRQICEGELAAAGVDRFVPSFDYSDEEWTEIEQSARLTCNKQLTDEVRQRLRQAGALYLTLSRAGNKFLKQQQLASISSWQSIRRLAGELHEQLDKANVPRVDGSKYGTLLKSLAKLTNNSSISSAKSLQSPRENYYSDVLGVWLDELGGRLGLSRGSNTHKLGGPLVRFFRAVTCPVLKTDAPALETISDIVGRERDRRTATSGRERLKKNREVPLSAVEGPVRPPTLPEIRYTDLGQLQISRESRSRDKYVNMLLSVDVQLVCGISSRSMVRAGLFSTVAGGVTAYCYQKPLWPSWVTQRIRLSFT